MIKSILLNLAFLLTAKIAFCQVPVAPIPKLVTSNGRHSLIVDGKPYFMLGAQVHNSSAWPAMMPQVWKAVQQIHANTVEIPIYWEQVEPQPGKYDFSLINTLITQSRQHNVRLVLLWFATWKNGSNHYMPAWMKKDAVKYPNITGKKGQPIDSPSPHSEATLAADAKAFTAVMTYLKGADKQRTVIMVQVENEPGSWDTVRDYSPVAQKLFESSVPAALLKPDVLKALNVPVMSSGTWKQVFGERADEYFQAWSIAHFIGQVAAAGKAIYPLPLYVNAALRDPLTNPMANEYESGGPTDNVIPIWKAAAPEVDLLAPDIYLSGSDKVLKVLDLYSRPDNALFVPEAGFKLENSKYLYEVIARGGIGFSPFGIDNDGKTVSEEAVTRIEPFAQDYATISPMAAEIAKWAYEGKINAVVEHEDHADQTIDLGQWEVTVSFGGDGRGNAAPVYDGSTGKLMIVKLDENNFLAIGSRCHIKFKPIGNNRGKAWQYLSVEEGDYESAVFKPLRVLNGDETDWGGPGFGQAPKVLRVALVVR
ncbi:hypothetical protein GS399_12610 [Pedobacter sp. HMF7647]|uniref:Beta-galactosidase n=1 Tax=Hufsiella arboris TaxID=2695275 RepID=A0A7K1YCJ5_9SPHI|nr:DUF5597 domain-containing protein [Hufsiella arboris]MXV51819.1 hypothetical protein [Hufsiella arboris]